MKIVITNDHTAIEMKNEILSYLNSLDSPLNIQVTDYGANSPQSVNYAEYGQKAARAVSRGDFDRGILICGTGIGMSIAANKVRGIRAAACSEPYSAKLSKEHNDSNVLCFGARVVGTELAKMIVWEWLRAEFQGGRHQERVDFIMQMENQNK